MSRTLSPMNSVCGSTRPNTPSAVSGTEVVAISVMSVTVAAIPDTARQTKIRQHVTTQGLSAPRSSLYGNALAPPVLTRREESGRVVADFHLGAAYEGPPGYVHSGVSALILDHLLGEAASPDRKPRFTGSITVRYLRATPLGPLRVEAVRTRTEGVKTYCTGHIADAEGMTVEAEGVFITPRWLRD